MLPMQASRGKIKCKGDVLDAARRDGMFGFTRRVVLYTLKASKIGFGANLGI